MAPPALHSGGWRRSRRPVQLLRCVYTPDQQPCEYQSQRQSDRVVPVGLSRYRKYLARILLGCEERLLRRIHSERLQVLAQAHSESRAALGCLTSDVGPAGTDVVRQPRSEERRVGKECRSRWAQYRYKVK